MSVERIYQDLSAILRNVVPDVELRYKAELAFEINQLKKEGKTVVVSSRRVTEVANIATRLIAVKNKKFYSLSKSRIKEVYK